MFIKKFYNYFWHLFDIFVSCYVNGFKKFLPRGRKFLLSLVRIDYNFSEDAQNRVANGVKKEISNNNEKGGTDSKPN